MMLYSRRNIRNHNIRSKITILLYLVSFFLLHNAKSKNYNNKIISNVSINISTYIPIISDLYSFIMSLKHNKQTFATVDYYKILPFHGNGIFKKDLNYRDYFNPDKIFIHHYTHYLNHNDKYENDTTFSIFLSENLKEDKKLIQKLTTKKFTLVYLFTISKISDFLIRQIKAMSHKESAFILFIDNKSNRTKLYNLFKQMNESKDRKLFENLYLVDSPRFIIEWGQITIPFSQIVMVCSILKYFPNSMYLSLHSETDYRVIPNNEIMKYLKLNYPTNFIALTPKLKLNLKKKRLKEFNLFVNNSKILTSIMKRIYPNRFIPNFNWSFGSNWVTLTVKDSKKIIEKILNDFSIIEYFEYSAVPDEVIFQTVASTINISFKKTNLRYINWKLKGCHPKTLNENDFNDIVNNSCNLWARKFKNNESLELLDKIDNYVKNVEKNGHFKSCSI